MMQTDLLPRISRSIFLLVCFSLVGSSAFAQGINVKFGKNRVQYHDFTWSFYQSDNFVTYYYLGGQEIGQFAAQVAERNLPDIERMLDYKLNTRIEILVFNDVTDLNMSNIGTGLEFNNIGGVTRILGNKIFIHFTGDHTDLRRQIREGIAQVLISNMIFGGNFQEVLQNAVLLSLPDWFVNGLVSYIGEKWSTQHDNRMRDGILSSRYKKFNKLTGEDARLAGHSFWYFVESKNGKEAIPNLLYLTRINRSLENGFLFVLGYTYSEAIEEWYKYFYNRYALEETQQEVIADSLALPIKNFKNREYTGAKLSPNGRYIAFVTNDIGKWRVHLYDQQEDKLKTIAKGGLRTRTLAIDYNYPVINWDPTGRKLLAFYEKRDVIQLLEYTVETREKKVDDITKFQRVTDFTFTDNPYVLVISAINRGQSDLYQYDLRSTTTKQLTNDFWDDLDPKYVDLGRYKGTIWSSNRPAPRLLNEKLDTVLPTTHFDLYFLYEAPGKTDAVLNLTQTPHLDEWQADQIAEGHYGMLAEDNGVYNRFAGYVDTTFSHFLHTVYYKDSIVNYRNGNLPALLAERSDIIDSFRTERMIKDTSYTFPLTDHARSIVFQDATYKNNKVLDVVYHDGAYRFFVNQLPDSPTVAMAPMLDNTAYRSKTRTSRRVAKVEGMEQKEEKPDPGFVFQSEFETGDTVRTIGDLEDEDEPLFKPTKVRPYRVKYSTEYVTTQLDNTVLINQYQNFVGNGPLFQSPDLGGLITMSISDLMEDYRWTGGFRIPTSFSGSEYFLRFEYLKKRLDYKLTYYRKGNFNTYRFVEWPIRDVRARQITNYAEAQVSYPFDIVRSLRATLGYRNYRINFLSLDTFSLILPPYIENWVTGKLEYVFDNTYEVSLNILNGMRYKVYYELHKQFDLQFHPFDFDLGAGTMHVIGTDIRHYLKVHRNIIWANRLAAATSFGTKKLIYYMGGVDNWLNPRFNNDLEVNFDNNYAFQTLATNMRGHQQNVRNGNSYAVINSELRIPVFSYLINTPIRSELIRNFQLIGFGDIGTAWEGFSPYDQDNPFNSEVIERGPVKVQAQYFRNPIVGGYGVGARTVLFGYFLRTDLAWGLDSGEVGDPIWYFSLNMDF